MAHIIPQRLGPSPRPGDILVVVHDFNARGTDELTLRKSDRVELIELDDGFGDGWYLGRHLSRDETGLFPGVYTTKAPSTVRPTQSQGLPRAATSQYATQSPVDPAVTTSSTASSHAQQQLNGDQNLKRVHNNAYETSRTSLPSSYKPQYPVAQRSISETLSANPHNTEDSVVMNETLSVIDEHITNLSTPRQSVIPPRNVKEDSESDYSSHLDRQSFVAGPETDDEENGRLTETDVRTWNHKKVAHHLRSIGVDPQHCDIFEDQEISGDVLLDMDQGFIYMKEYDFGVMGRRLKTWHKIREFQDEAKGQRISRQSTFSNQDQGSSADDMSTRSQSRIMSGASYLPRIPSLMEKPGLKIRHSQPNVPKQEGSTPPPLQPGYARASVGANTPPSPWRSSMIAESPSRPSAASVRELTHSGRHSFIDYDKPLDPGTSNNYETSQRISHLKQDSLDRDWSMSGSTAVNAVDSPSQHSFELKKEQPERAITPQLNTPLSNDLDRGYFSGNEVDNRKNRTTLRKRDSGSYTAHTRKPSVNTTSLKQHSRLASVDSVRPNGRIGDVSAARAYQGSAGSLKGRLRSASARDSPTRMSPSITSPPAVTNLEKEGLLTSPRSTLSSSSNPLSSMQNKAKKFIGIRAASDNVSHPEKIGYSAADQSLENSARTSPFASPTGSTTPSQASHSLEYDNSESSKLVALSALPRPTRTRPKAKQETSAYTRGLLKISPAEARKTCDYHGWMKKKSSSLMTTWKPRLFILRGRRLSYYYAETDTEERGIIDISGHKVLVANSDAMVTLHAQLTGATSAASPSASSIASSEPSPVLVRTPDSSSSSPFYFKLIPPKSGMSRAVQFTKPAIHYFQVDSVLDGRKWMGEIMKATIMHDWSTLQTTNKQKTISLAKARARGERPAVLLGDEPVKVAGLGSAAVRAKVDEAGLNIQGLDLEDTRAPLNTTEKNEQDKENASVSGTAASEISTS